MRSAAGDLQTPCDAPLPGTGADLSGWSALPLLGRVADWSAPWLFLASRTLAWLSAGRLADKRFVQTVAEYDRAWPFGDGVLEGIVIDGDRLADGANEAVLERVLAEAGRVARRSDNVLVACGHHLVPRRLHAWREYGRHSARAWRGAAVRLGLTTGTAAYVRMDGDRLTDVTLAVNNGSREALASRQADRAVLRLGSPVLDEGAIDARVPRSAIESMVADLRTRFGSGDRIDRIAVRKIGKTAVFLSGGDGRRWILRVARSPIALSRAQRNYETLEALHGSSLPAQVKQCAPAPVGRGAEAGYAYFVESCLEGQPGPSPAAAKAGEGAWDSEAVDYITAVHRGTLRRVHIEQTALARLVHEPVGRVIRGCGSLAAERVLHRIASVCEARLAGGMLPLVRTHGDFTAANCLYGSSGRLTAVVDWEVSVADGLPFLDLLQLMPVRGEISGHVRWQRFDAWLDLYRQPARAAQDPVMRAYLQGFDIPLDMIPGLVLLQWVTHIADRIDARREDEQWMQRRVWQPLESLEGC